MISQAISPQSKYGLNSAFCQERRMADDVRRDWPNGPLGLLMTSEFTPV